MMSVILPLIYSGVFILFYNNIQNISVSKLLCHYIVLSQTLFSVSNTCYVKFTFEIRNSDFDMNFFKGKRPYRYYGNLELVHLPQLLVSMLKTMITVVSLMKTSNCN